MVINLNIDISEKAESIIERMTCIFDDKMRLGVIDHQKNLQELDHGGEEVQCKTCNQTLTSLEKYWYINSCECCERSEFLDNEVQKFDVDNGQRVRSYVLYRISDNPCQNTIN